MEVTNMRYAAGAKFVYLRRIFEILVSRSPYALLTSIG